MVTELNENLSLITLYKTASVLGASLSSFSWVTWFFCKEFVFERQLNYIKGEVTESSRHFLGLCRVFIILGREHCI